MRSLTLELIADEEEVQDHIKEHDPYWKIEFPYDAEFIEWIKRTIPHTERTWNPGAEPFWTIADRWKDKVIERGKGIFEAVYITEYEGDEKIEINAITGQRTVQPSLFDE